MKKMLSLAALCAVTFAASSVAVVDLNVLIQNSEYASVVKPKLEQEAKNIQAKLEASAQEMEKIAQDLEKNGSAMKADDLEKKKAALAKKQNDYAQQQMTAQQDLYKKNQEALNKIFEKIRLAAEKVAKRLKIDLVLPKAEVVFAEQDITIEVQKALKEGGK